MIKKDENIENIDVLNVGLFGHIDHGKTTLLQQLTGKWTDTHSEELKRGITIKLGYADVVIKKREGKQAEEGEESYNIKDGTPKRYITFIDAPGHEMLMATMLSGAAIIDAAILVIAANEGIKPQTKEHLTALQIKNITNLIIIQNKIDLINEEQAKKNYEDIKKLIKRTRMENAPIIPISAQQGVNINMILEELCKIKIPQRDTKSEPLFVVARSFDVNKPGTKIKSLKGGVLGGILKQGILRVGDEIEIKPGLSEKKENKLVYETVKTKILSIHRGKTELKQATPGGSLAIETELDPYITKTDTLSGCIAGLKNKLPEISDNIKLKFHLFKEVFGTGKHEKVTPVKTQEMLMLSVNTSITVGTVLRVKDDEAELVLKIPIVAFKGENVGIARNIGGHWRLIGWGEIL